MGKLKVLVLGDGLLGSELVKQTNWENISRKRGDFDIGKIAFYLGKHKPDVIINCIANTDTYSTNRESHWEINCSFVSNLINYCNLNLIKLVHISTDYIYSGSVNNASEEDVPVHCNNWYGYTKLIGDGLVQLQSNNHLIIRCTHKPNPFPYESAWIDQIGNFDYVDIIASKIIGLVNKKINGVYNLGTETKTMYDLATRTKEVTVSFTPSHAPKNQSMDLTKINKIL